MLLCPTILVFCGILQCRGAKGHSAGGLAEELSNTPLDMQQQQEIKKAVRRHAYTRAERLLLAEIGRHPHSPVMLRILGGIFFLDGKYLNSAIAYKKSEAIAPLDAPSRYTLAMAYIVLKHADWARPELEELARSEPRNALYPYWLSRLDYDAMRFNDAIQEDLQAIKIDPKLMKAYDNLGLCYEGLGQYGKAITSYRMAERLNQDNQTPSPWPCLNMGALLIKMGQLDEAEKSLREALRFDPKFPKAHFQLGILFERQGRYANSLAELQKAVEFDPAYADPYYVLGQIYQRLGDKNKADSAIETFRHLKSAH